MLFHFYGGLLCDSTTSLKSAVTRSDAQEPVINADFDLCRALRAAPWFRPVCGSQGQGSVENAVKTDVSVRVCRS